MLMNATCSGRLSRKHFAVAGALLRMKKKGLPGGQSYRFVGQRTILSSRRKPGQRHQNAVPNDFAALLKQYPQVQRLLFNGQKAFGLFERFSPDILEYVDYEVLPSTSPANAAVPYEKKLELWLEALRSRAVSGRC